MGAMQDELRTVLREELQVALSDVRLDVQKLHAGLADAVTRIQQLERHSPWQSPRSALRSAGSSEPARKSSRGSVGFSSQKASEDIPVSSDTFILNTFPEKTSREEIREWLGPLAKQMVGDAEFSVSSRNKYCTRVFVRFSSAMRAQQFSTEWRKEPRYFPGQSSTASRIYISWKLSPSRAKDEFIHRQFFSYAKEVLQLLPPKLEREKSSRTIYYDKVLLARIDDETVHLTTAGKTYANVEKFQTWLASREEQRRSL